MNLWSKPGTVAYASQFIKHLALRDDINLRLVVPTRFPDELVPPSAHVTKVNAPEDVSGEYLGALLAQPLSVPLFLARLLGLPADILHQNFTHPWMTLLLPVLSKRFPYVQNLHDAVPHPGEETLRNKLAIKVACACADRLIVHGERIRKTMIEQCGVPSSRVVIIPHGDYAFYTQHGNQKLQTEPRTILFFGRILPYKGLDVLFDALSIVLRTLPDAKLIIAGSGDIKPYDAKLTALHSNIELHNYQVSDAEVADFYRRAAVVAIPYLEGSQSGPLITALGFRKPVVATDVGCFSDVVEQGTTGLLVPPKDPQRLALALLHILTNPEDAAIMGQRAYEKMTTELNWDRVAEMTVQVYRGVVERRH